MTQQASRFRKKPVEITAVRYDGSSAVGVAIGRLTDFGASIQPTEHWSGACDEPQCDGNRDVLVYNSSHDDWNLVHPGDWIIHGVSGEFYPCDPVTFEATYDLVE